MYEVKMVSRINRRRPQTNSDTLVLLFLIRYINLFILPSSDFSHHCFFNSCFVFCYNWQRTFLRSNEVWIIIEKEMSFSVDKIIIKSILSCRLFFFSCITVMQIIDFVWVYGRKKKQKEGKCATKLMLSQEKELRMTI